MLNLYLDTSALLRRYVSEPGSEIVDTVFDKAEAGEITISFSLWNIGEALGVLDEKLRRGWLTEEEFEQVLRLFAEETLKLMRQKNLNVNALQTQILTSAWEPILKEHLYEADAIQVVTAQQNETDSLLTSDKKLAQTTKKDRAKYLPYPRRSKRTKKLH